MRASRLIHLMLLLQRDGRVTAARAAEVLEVSIRTVYRDVEALSEAGIPVYTESGPGGGISLVDGWETRLTGFTADETTALGFTAIPEAAAQLGLGAVIGAAQAKIDAALPPELRSRAARVRDRFLVDAPGWFERTAQVPCLPALAQAVWDGRQVDLEYQRRPDGQAAVRRTVSPLGLVLKGGSWYVLAGVEGSETVRTYRVDRVRALSLRADRVVRPPGFDLADAWSRASAAFATSMFRIRIKARVRADRLWHLKLALTEAAAASAISSAGEEQDGWRPVVIPSESIAVAVSELLRMGDGVEVLDPPELRAEIAAVTARMAELHGGVDSGLVGVPPTRA